MSSRAVKDILLTTKRKLDVTKVENWNILKLKKKKKSCFFFFQGDFATVIKEHTVVSKAAFRGQDWSQPDEDRLVQKIIWHTFGHLARQKGNRKIHLSKGT